jgi:hypothetical protein
MAWWSQCQQMRECICAKEQVIYTDSSVAPLRAPLRSSPPPEEGLREAATQSLPTTPPSLRIDLVLVPRSLVSDTRESQSRGARPSMMHDMMHDGNDLFGTYQLTGQDTAPLCSALCDFSATTSANPYTHPLRIALNRQQYSLSSNHAPISCRLKRHEVVQSGWPSDTLLPARVR